MSVFTLAKRAVLMALVLVLWTSASNAQWSDVGANIPTTNPTYQAGTAYLDGKLYMFGGLTGSTVTNTAYCLDLSNTGAGWKAIKSMPASMCNCCAQAVNGKIYIFAGAVPGSSSWTPKAVNYEYDPSTNTYASKTPMTKSAFWCSSAVVNGKIYCMNGFTGSAVLTSCQMYDPSTDKWSTQNNTLVGCALGTATSIGNYIYVIGGQTTSSSGIQTAMRGTVGATNVSWAQISDFPAPGFGASAGSIGGNLYVAGGSNASTGESMTNKCYVYDTTNDAWNVSYTMPDYNLLAGPMVGDGSAGYIFSGEGNLRTLKYVPSPTPVAVLALSQAAVYDSIYVDDANMKTLTISNYGVVPLTLDVSTPTADEWLTVTTLSKTIQPGASFNMEAYFDGTGMKVGTYNSSITLATNDPSNMNVTVPVVFNIYDVNGTAKRVNLLEVFTSSTCPPCKPGNENLAAVLTSFDEATYAIVKYQQNYPGVGDPYSTVESQNRHTGFYGINSIPRLEIDGGFNNSPGTGSFSETDLLSSEPIISLMNMSSTYSVDPASQHVEVSVNLNPISDHVSPNNTLYVAVCEKTTDKNVMTNLETSFEHVMKKMLPDENGTKTGPVLVSNPPTKTFSYTFPGSYRLPTNGQSNNIINLATENSVEDFNNLEVVVWMQDSKTKQVFNATHSVQIPASVDVDIANINALQLGDCKPNPTNTFGTLQYFTPSNGKISIDLVDITGTTVRTLFSGFQSVGAHDVFVNTSNLASGMYQVVVRSGNSSVAKPVVVTH